MNIPPHSLSKSDRDNAKVKQRGTQDGVRKLRPLSGHSLTTAIYYDAHRSGPKDSRFKIETLIQGPEKNSTASV